MTRTKTLFVGGTFDDRSGKESKIAKILVDGLTRYESNSTVPLDISCYNGGNIHELENIVQTCQDYDVIFWFPNISNIEPKMVRQLKVINPRHILITSKNNLENKYDFVDLVYHALNNHSNLFLEFARENPAKESSAIKGRIIDPLGNVFLDGCDDFYLASAVLKERVSELTQYVRMSSTELKGCTQTTQTYESDVFLRIVKNYANRFHELIHPKGDATTRFMGNASFRCTYGFPSVRTGNGIMVSKRNIDKRELDMDSFVFVKNDWPVQYYGNFKPSVDTPVQIGLYNHYTDVNYMIHSHTYIMNAPFTENITPCGALEEIADIVEMFPDRSSKNFSINLRGHGSIVLASKISNLENISHYARPLPEIHEIYKTKAEEILRLHRLNKLNIGGKNE